LAHIFLEAERKRIGFRQVTSIICALESQATQTVRAAAQLMRRAWALIVISMGGWLSEAPLGFAAKADPMFADTPSAAGKSKK
jgi:hypothetical protein